MISTRNIGKLVIQAKPDQFKFGEVPTGDFEVQLGTLQLLTFRHCHQVCLYQLQPQIALCNSQFFVCWENLALPERFQFESPNDVWSYNLATLQHVDFVALQKKIDERTVAFFPLNGSTDCKTNAKYNASQSDNVTYSPGLKKDSQALKVASNTRIEIPQLGRLTHSWTISVWLKEGDNENVSDTSNTKLTVGPVSIPDQINQWFAFVGTTAGKSVPWNPNMPFPNGKFMHYVITFDGMANLMSIYYDRLLINKHDFTAEIAPKSSPIALFAMAKNIIERKPGDLDWYIADLRFLDVTVDEYEVICLYNLPFLAQVKF